MQKGVIGFTNRLVIGATGAITSQDAAAGFVVTRISPGLYTITFPVGYKRIVRKGVDFETTPTAIANGFPYNFLTNNLDSGTKVGTIQIQFMRGDTYAAAELVNPSTIVIWFELAEGT
jgi:hypothetical protein